MFYGFSGWATLRGTVRALMIAAITVIMKKTHFCDLISCFGGAETRLTRQYVEFCFYVVPAMIVNVGNP